jgi:hypothetical protein
VGLTGKSPVTLPLLIQGFLNQVMGERNELARGFHREQYEEQSLRGGHPHEALLFPEGSFPLHAFCGSVHFGLPRSTV